MYFEGWVYSYTVASSSLIHKHQTMLERLAGDNQSNLMRTFINIGPMSQF